MDKVQVERSGLGLLGARPNPRAHSPAASASTPHGVLDAELVLMLQRSAGNTAVAAFMKQQTGLGPAAAVGSAVVWPSRDVGCVLQRTGEAGEDTTGVRRSGTLPYREAKELTDCIRILGEQSAAYCRQVVLGEQPLSTPSSSCTQLTDFPTFFKGSPPPGATAEGAATAIDYPFDGGTFRAQQDPNRSWVDKDKVAVAGQRNSPTKRNVEACEKATDAGQGYWVGPDAACPATAVTRHEARIKSECESEIGAKLDAEEAKNEARLLKHEQYHMNLACVLAEKANERLRSTGNLDQVRKVLKAAHDREHKAYDNASKKSCDTAGQSAWEQKIDSGAIPFP